jgi:hypothetical protein
MEQHTVAVKLPGGDIVAQGVHRSGKALLYFGGERGGVAGGGRMVGRASADEGFGALLIAELEAQRNRPERRGTREFDDVGKSGLHRDC